MAGISSDNRIVRLLGRLGDLILINFFILLCSLPVVTAGAALTAGCACLKEKEGPEERSTARVFFHAFGANFKTATGIWLLLLLGLVLGVGDMIYAVGVAQEVNLFYVIFALLLLLVVTGIGMWVFPLLAAYENSFSGYLRNAFYLMIGRFPRTVIMWCIWLVPAVLCLLFSPFFVVMGFIWVCCGVAVQLWATCALALRAAKKLSHN